jgi:hypothetical protein
MKKFAIFFFVILALLLCTVIVVFVLNRKAVGPLPSTQKAPVVIVDSFAIKQKARLKQKGRSLQAYFNSTNVYNETICFFVDMSLPSGRNRFFVYDLGKDSVVNSGLVAHGSCNTTFLAEAKFNNTEGCGCSAIGKYKVGYSYDGRFGLAYKLYGLDKSNNNAFKRFIVLHAYDCVPNVETFPEPICNSLGCPMVSYKFLNDLQKYIKASKKPILLWVFK